MGASVDERLEGVVAEAARAGERAQVVMVLESSAQVERFAGDRDAVVEHLKATAEESQRVLEEHLMADRDARGDPRIVNRFWIQNMVLVEFEASASGLEALAAVPGVERLVPNFEVAGIEPEAGEVSAATVDDRTWGVDRIEAHRVHDELGLDGSGVRVATLDTGVAIDHPDLVDKMATDDPNDPAYPGGWMEFDGDGNLVASSPHDSADHGTHVSGTIHGGDTSDIQIGVAPGADMMHGLVIPGGSGTFVQVAAGMQWAIDPVDAAGNPAGEPADVVNMSLGGCGIFQEMVEPTRNMRAADVFPAFAIGNAGLTCPNCGDFDTSSPGNVYEAVGVGATDVDDDVAAFSCGALMHKDDWPQPPADWPDTYMKPDLSAPGVDVISSMPDGGYDTKSGTSMASPHLAGAVALMREAAPDLTVDALQTQLADTSFFDDRHGPDRPNDRFGHGRINAFEATEPIALDSGITGTVTDADSGETVAGATVTADTGRTITSAEDGTYTLRLEPGTYDLDANAFGYDPTTITGIEVSEDTFTTQDIELDPAPAGSLAGTVTLDDTGNGIPGVQIEIQGTDLTATTDTDGNYQIPEIPIGDYTVTATAVGFPDPPPQDITITTDQTTTADFAVESPSLEIGVMGDFNGTVAGFLDDHGLANSEFEFGDDLAGFGTIVLNRAPDPGEDGFLQFLADTDAAGIGVIFTDQWSSTNTPIGLMITHLGIPESRSTGFSSSIPYTYYEVTQEHPVLDGWAVGDEIVFDESSGSNDHAWFDGYAGADRMEIADAGRADQEDSLGPGIGVEDRANNRHVLLSMHSATTFIDPGDWTDDGGQILLNAIDWAGLERGDDDPIFVVSDLEVDPGVVMAGEPVDVSADVTNVGGSSGEHTVTLAVAGSTEDTATVTLDPGETESVSWTVTRDELGTYTVSVAHLQDQFRVRPPVVELSAMTVDGAGSQPGPLGGAHISLVYDGQLVEVGMTDADGLLTFEAPEADAEYTVVARRDPTDDHGYSYLLTRPERIDDDATVEFAPRTLATGDMGAQFVWNFSSVVDIGLDQVGDGHDGLVYLRSSLVEPFGFAVEPGALVTTVTDADGMEAVNVHAVDGLERDWFGVSQVVDGLVWQDPIDYSYAFGGDATVELDAGFTEGTEFAAQWAVTDAHGYLFDQIASTELQPFVDLPDVVELEDVAGLVEGLAPDPGEIIMRIFGPDGQGIHGGGLTWEQTTIERDLADLIDGDPDPGTYTLEIEVETGTYSGQLIDTDELHLAAPVAPERTLTPDTIERGDSFEVTITFTPGDDAATLTEAIAPADDNNSGDTSIGNGWPVTDWTTDADATYDDQGTWTFAGLTPGETTTLTYTVAAPLNITTPSDWTLHGELTIDDITHTVEGDTHLTVTSNGNNGRGGGGGGGGNGNGGGNGGGSGNGNGR